MIRLSILTMLLTCTFGAPVGTQYGARDLKGSVRVPIFPHPVQPSPSEAPVILPAALLGISASTIPTVEIFPEPSAEPSQDMPTPEPLPASPTPSVSADNKRSCIPAHAKVELAGGGSVPASEIRVGDLVRVGLRTYSPVLAITHADDAARSEMVSVRTAHASLLLSPGHLLKSNGILIPAHALRVGDGIAVMINGRLVVESVLAADTEITRGLYNPQTASGELLVSIQDAAPVLISAYTTAVQPSGAHAMLSPLRTLYRTTGVTIPDLSKIFTAIHFAESLRKSSTIAAADNCIEMQSQVYQSMSWILLAAFSHVTVNHIL